MQKIDFMSAMLRHFGIWEGTYTHLSPIGELLDQHRARVVCEFPEQGEYAYIQHNLFTWPDGREYRVSLPAVFRDGKLWWNNARFHGYCWQCEGLVMLRIDRKDEPNAYFIETIVLGESGRHRSRTWQWFRDGQMYKTTLCHESRVE